MEVRYSYGTVALAGLAWLGICTSWISPEILKAVSPSVDRSLVNDLALGNGVLIAAAASLLANLTYARFVFLRSNGFILAKPKQIKSRATLPFRPLRERTDARRTRASRKAVAAADEQAPTKVEQPVAEQPVAKQARKSSRKGPAKAKVVKPARARVSKASPTAKPTAKPKPVAAPEPVSVTPPAAAVQEEPPAKQVSLSASERLKQLAAATRIQKTPEQTDDQQAPATVKMSKAQRRKLRKQQKNQKRAA